MLRQFAQRGQLADSGTLLGLCVAVIGELHLQIHRGREGEVGRGLAGVGLAHDALVDVRGLQVLVRHGNCRARIFQAADIVQVFSSLCYAASAAAAAGAVGAATALWRSSFATPTVMPRRAARCARHSYRIALALKRDPPSETGETRQQRCGFTRQRCGVNSSSAHIRQPQACCAPDSNTRKILRGASGCLRLVRRFVDIAQQC